MGDSSTLNGELNPMKKPRTFTVAFKQEAARRMQAGESPSALARELKVRRKLLYQWRDAVEAGRPLRGKPGRPPGKTAAESPPEETSARVRELEQLVGQLTLENRFFKGALRRIKELRRESRKAGVVGSSRKSKR
jgi:transposase-like protein